MVQFFDLMKKYSLVSGILLFALITSIVFLVFPYGLFYPGDIYYVAGAIMGSFYTFRYFNSVRSYYWVGFMVGAIGATMATFLISLFYTLFYGTFFLAIFLGLIIMGLMIGIVIGLMFGYFKSRDARYKTNQTGDPDKFDINDLTL